MKRFYLFLFFIFNIYTARTQDSILIQSKLKEVTVTATRTTLSLKQLAQSIFTVRAEDIQSMAAQNTGEILQKTGLITVQKSQQGGGSPILRGMEASRVLLVLDGLRMNNIMYRAGHLQSIITVDPNILDRVEVLFGPASSVYGSDALGGVIHLISKSPDYASNSQYHSNVHMRYSTVNHEKMFHYDAQYAAQRFSALFSGSFTDFDDLRGGKNKNPFYTSYYGQRSVYYKSENGNDILIDNSKTPWIQASSGYKQWDLMGKIKFQSKSGKDHLFNLQYSSSSEIPRYDRLTDPSSTSVLRFS